MITVDNKFEVGEKAFTIYRVPVHYKCPVCEGEGKFVHNGYEVQCRKCSGGGKLHDVHNTFLVPIDVTVSSIKISYNGTKASVRYKLYSNKNVNNRSEETMFKTLEETENYCKCINTKEITPEF